jgi:hypothetical protein
MERVIYKFVENHKPNEVECRSVTEATLRAIKDMGSNTIYPKEIVTVVMDRDAIEQAWENQFCRA